MVWAVKRQILADDPLFFQPVRGVGDSIAMADDKKRVKAYEKRFKVKFPIFPDKKLEVYMNLGRTGTPYMILTTTSGDVLWTHYGLIDLEETLGLIRDFHKKL